jgi:hypothetical protein
MNELIWRPSSKFIVNVKKGIEEKNEQSQQKDNSEFIKEKTNDKAPAPTPAQAQAQEFFYDNNGIFRATSSKREEVNLKMNDRDPISQTNQNPYLVQNNYLDDLMNQNNFLIPKNSNFDKEKNK